MAIVNLTDGLYFRTSVPWARRKGLTVAHKPHQTSPYLKAWQDFFAGQAAGLFNSGEAKGRMGMASAMAGKLEGRGNKSASTQRQEANRQAKHRIALARAGRAAPAARAPGPMLPGF